MTMSALKTWSFRDAVAPRVASNPLDADRLFKEMGSSFCNDEVPSISPQVNLLSLMQETFANHDAKPAKAPVVSTKDDLMSQLRQKLAFHIEMPAEASDEAFESIFLINKELERISTNPCKTADDEWNKKYLIGTRALWARSISSSVMAAMETLIEDEQDELDAAIFANDYETHKRVVKLIAYDRRMLKNLERWRYDDCLGVKVHRD